jgi:hypothetical protein
MEKIGRITFFTWLNASRRGAVATRAFTGVITAALVTAMALHPFGARADEKPVTLTYAPQSEVMYGKAEDSKITAALKLASRGLAGGKAGMFNMGFLPAQFRTVVA